MDRDIKNKLDEILSLYDKDECRCGGYSMTQYSHITAPEDYIESRTDWESLRDMVTTANDGISCLVGILGKVLEENKRLKEKS